MFVSNILQFTKKVFWFRMIFVLRNYIFGSKLILYVTIRLIHTSYAEVSIGALLIELLAAVPTDAVFEDFVTDDEEDGDESIGST